VLASVFARRLIRLQCYEGIDTNQALYEWDYARQMLQIRALSERQLGSDEAVTVRLYKEAGVRVVPGSYLARLQPDGFNPGAGFIRLALVQDGEATAEALHRLVETLG